MVDSGKGSVSMQEVLEEENTVTIMDLLLYLFKRCFLSFAAFRHKNADVERKFVGV